jgi:DNA mismatch repair ATPase MutS
MNTKEEKELIYGVYILRKDGNHIVALEVNDYDEAFSYWEKLQEKWENTIKEKKPFSITNPVVTAFDPGLIVEINLKPVVETTESRYKNHNPYRDKMVKEGFSNALNYPDLLDSGYR